MNRGLGFGFGLISSSNIAGDPAVATLTPTELVSATTGNGITDIPINASSATEGYLMVLLVTVWANVSITDYPAGWNLERTGKEGSSSGQSQLYAFSKIASSSESTSYTFTVSGNLYGDRFTYSLLEIPQTGLGVRNATYSTDATLGKLYSYSNNTLHLALCGKGDYSATEDVVHPTGYTELLDRTGSLHNHAIAYKEISGASRALSSGTDEFTDPDNDNTTGDNNLSNIHLAISNEGSIISENYEGTGTPVGFTTTTDGSGTITFDETTTVLEGSKSLKVYNDNSATNDTYTYVDLNEEYDHIVAIFGYNITSMSNRKDIHFLDDELDFGATSCMEFGSVSSYTKGINHAYGAISLTMTGTINNFHYVRVEINHSGGVVKIARSNDKTFPTSGDNYAEDTSASFNSSFSGTRAIAFGTRDKTLTTYYDDLEVTGEIKNYSVEVTEDSPIATRNLDGAAETFNGSTSYTIGDSSTISAIGTSDNFTLEAIVSVDSLSGDGTLIGLFRGGSNVQALLWFDEGGTANFRGVFRDGGSTNRGLTAETPTGYSVAINTEYHVVYTYDGTNVKLYVDGAEVDSVAETSNVGAPSYDYEVGDDGSNGRYLDGTLRGAAIYDKALSASRILAHYNAIE